MKRVDTHIKIGNYVFNYCSEADVESSWDKFANTARIVVPRKLTVKGEPVKDISSLFKKGDAVEILSGYDGKLNPFFTGHITGIGANTPIEFTCEDEMWQLKRNPFTASYDQVTLKELLSDHCTIPFEAVDVSLGQFRISKASLFQVLQELKKTYGLISWIRDGKLYSGLAYWPEMANEVTFKLGYNTIEDDLSYVKEDDVRLKVKAISMLPDNSKIEIELGDPEGEERTLHFYNLTEADLKKHAEKEIEKLRFEGFRGSFTAFGEPFVRHGDIAKIIDPVLDRSGRYYIKNVGYSTGINGIRQTIQIDRLA